MEKSLVFFAGVLFVCSCLSVSPPHEVDNHNPSPDINQDKLFEESDSFTGHTYEMTVNESVFGVVSNQSTEEIIWKENLSKEGQKLIKFGDIFEGKTVGVVYNESIEIYKLNGKRIGKIKKETSQTNGKILKASREGENIYLGETTTTNDGLNFTISKYTNDKIVWRKNLSSGSSTGGYWPRIVDIEVLENNSLIIAAEGPIPNQKLELETVRNTYRDLDWKIYRVSDEGKLAWTNQESSMKGTDTVKELKIEDDKIILIGTFPEEKYLRKASYQITDGERLSQKKYRLQEKTPFYIKIADKLEIFGDEVISKIN